MDTARQLQKTNAMVAVLTAVLMSLFVLVALFPLALVIYVALAFVEVVRSVGAELRTIWADMPWGDL
jgi:hypothetical protein